MNYPKTLAAAKKAKRSEWGLAEALYDEIGPTGSESRLSECQAELAENGIDYTVSYLAQLHAAERIRRRVPDPVRTGWERKAWFTPSNVSRAGSVGVIQKAEEWAEEEADEETGEPAPITYRFMDKVRKAETHHARQATGKRQMPARDRDRVTKDRTVSETRRTVNVLQLVNLASDADTDGRTFVEKLAGQEITTKERNDLEQYVQDVIETWKAALSAVRNPLSKSVERFLEEVS